MSSLEGHILDYRRPTTKCITNLATGDIINNVRMGRMMEMATTQQDLTTNDS